MATITEATQTHKKSNTLRPQSLWASFGGKLLLFCGISVYLELCLHLCIFRVLDAHSVYLLLFGAAAGTLITLLVSALPAIPQRILAVLLVFAQVLLAQIQVIYQAVFGNLMPIQQVGMGGGVLNDFWDQTIYTIGQNIWKVLLLALPLAVLIVVVVRGGLRTRIRLRQILCLPAILLVLGGGALLLMRYVCAHPVSAWRVFRDVNASTDLGYRHLGMTATTFTELAGLISERETVEETLPISGETEGGSVYDPRDWNVIPALDFAALAASTEDPSIKKLDNYFAARIPTKKNAYTGLFKDWNVIEICAESYCPWFISEELTPTLYRMSHSGIVFDHYYGTFNSMTTNGEYSLCLGLLPDMTRTKTDSSFDVSVGHYLPFCLGTELKEYGYSTWAYHNNNGEFYNRSRTHPNMGYTFRSQGDGLNVTPLKPASDLEMMEQSTADYLQSDKPFHAYYMTYSGHYQYSWTNAMSEKNRAATEGLPYSDTVRAYVACNLELEKAMACLEQQLEEAGKLDRTLIILTNDHYPYGLSEAEYNELAGQKIDVAFEKYRNHFICYCPGLGKTVHVSEYCSTVDILPTLLNLLGVEYDSRLLAGTDVFSDGRHAAILQDGSFVTDRFRYCESTGELQTADPTDAVDAQTLQEYRNWVSERFLLSREILYTNYYQHVFPDNHHSVEINTLPFDDMEGFPVRNQGNILFIYRKGLVDLYEERTFAPKKAALLGDYVTAIYRFVGSPEVSEAALPEGYLGEDPEKLSAFRQSNQHDAVCWAFAQGLFRPDDRRTDYTMPLDNVEICLLIYRTAELLELMDLSVDQTMIDSFEADNEGITDQEIRAVVWAVQNGIIRGNSAMNDNLFDDIPENVVDRYRLVLFLLKLLYPEIVI